MDDFLIRALAAGIGTACITGPLGCFVVWQRMAYFGDALAHSALLGVALGLLSGLNITGSIVAICLLATLLMSALRRNTHFTTDLLLGILAHSGLALGLIAVSFARPGQSDLFAWLFGDILTVRDESLWLIAGTVVFGLLVLWRNWSRLLTLTINEELAAAEGIPVTMTHMTFTLLLALVVALSVQVVGVLLVTALLIIPAAAARGIARSPETMAVGAIAFGCLAVIGGLAASWAMDIPSGPAIVVAALTLFILTLPLSRRA